MENKCGARLVIPRCSLMGETGNFITCLGEDRCPFESKLNNQPVDAVPTYRQYFDRPHPFNLANIVSHEMGNECARGFSQISRLNSADEWQIKPNKGVRLINRALKHILPQTR